jgi:hypothetical protein
MFAIFVVVIIRGRLNHRRFFNRGLDDRRYFNRRKFFPGDLHITGARGLPLAGIGDGQFEGQGFLVLTCIRGSPLLP